MQTREIRVLFCDNEPDRHNTFLQMVVPVLERRFSQYRLYVHHSQSLDPEYEQYYDSLLRRRDARSVWTFMGKAWKWDLVISDIDFEKDYKMGLNRTGVDILRAVERQSRRLYWCEMVLITRYSGEQSRALHREIGGMMQGRLSVVDLTGTNPEENWNEITAKAAAHLEDALAVRDGLKGPPDIYDIRLFRSKDEGTICLTVWDRDDRRCRYSHAFDGMEQDVLMALHRHQKENAGEFMKLNDLRRAVRGEMAGRQGAIGSNTADNIRTRVAKMRHTFVPTRQPKEDSPLTRRVGKIHETDHLSGDVCGGCVIFSPKRGGAGYAFGGTSEVAELDDILPCISTEGVLKDPEAVWDRWCNHRFGIR